jgi:hypothetical protein
LLGVEALVMRERRTGATSSKETLTKSKQGNSQHARVKTREQGESQSKQHLFLENAHETKGAMSSD